MRRSMAMVLIVMTLAGSAPLHARARQVWQTRDASVRLERTEKHNATELRFEAGGRAVRVRYELESESGPLRMTIDAPEGRFVFRAGLDGELLEGAEDVRSWIGSDTFHLLRHHGARLFQETSDPQVQAEAMILFGGGLDDLGTWWMYQTCYMQKDELAACVSCCDRTGALGALGCAPMGFACVIAVAVVVIYCHATCEIANPV